MRRVAIVTREQTYSNPHSCTVCITSALGKTTKLYRQPNPNPSPFSMEWKQIHILLVAVRYGSLPVHGCASSTGSQQDEMWLGFRVHIIAQRANRYIVAFRIAISRYRRILYLSGDVVKLKDFRRPAVM